MPVNVCVFGQLDYLQAQTSMSEFTAERDSDEPDQIWLLQHPPVYTQGTACQQQPLTGSSIQVVKSDRGGQITYHGPGQVVMYPLLNLKRFKLGVKSLVAALEQSAINLLEDSALEATRRVDAPGVYLNQAKIAALGLRIRRAHSYHGLSLNVNMDLSPFSNIDPCGFSGLQVTQMADHVAVGDVDEIAKNLMRHFIRLI